MHCLPPTGLSSGTVSLFWLALFLTTVGALVLVLSRRRSTGPLSALLIVGIAVAAVGGSTLPADAAPIDDACTATATSAPTAAGSEAVAPLTSPTTLPAAGAPTTAVASTAVPPVPMTTAVPTTVPVAVPVTVPPLGACGALAVPDSFVPSGLGQGVLLLDPGAPWLPPAGWSITGGVSVEVEVGLRTELAQGVPGPTLPVALLPFTSVPGTITAAVGRVEVDLDVVALRVAVETLMADYLAATGPAEPYSWLIEERLVFTVAHDGACPDQRVIASADGVLGAF